MPEAVAANAPSWNIELLEPPAAGDDDLLRVHCPAYVQRMIAGTATDNELRCIEFPWSLVAVRQWAAGPQLIPR